MKDNCSYVIGGNPAHSQILNRQYMYTNLKTLGCYPHFHTVKNFVKHCDATLGIYTTIICQIFSDVGQWDDIIYLSYIKMYWEWRIKFLTLTQLTLLKPNLAHERATRILLE